MSTPPAPVHHLHVAADGRAHLHWHRMCSTDEVQRAGHAARVFLGHDRRVPSGIARGLYPFRVADDGNAIIGARIKPKPRGKA